MPPGSDPSVFPGLLLYLDPGSGSLLLQLLAAGAAGLVVFLRMQGRRLFSRFRRRRDPEQEADHER